MLKKIRKEAASLFLGETTSFFMCQKQDLRHTTGTMVLSNKHPHITTLTTAPYTITDPAVLNVTSNSQYKVFCLCTSRLQSFCYWLGMFLAVFLYSEGVALNFCLKRLKKWDKFPKPHSKHICVIGCVVPVSR